MTFPYIFFIALHPAPLYCLSILMLLFLLLHLAPLYCLWFLLPRPAPLWSPASDPRRPTDSP